MFPSSDPAIHMPDDEAYDPTSVEGQYLQNASTIYIPNQGQSGATSEQIVNVFEPPAWSTEDAAAQDDLDFAPSDFSQDGTDGWNAGVGQSQHNSYQSQYATYQQASAPAQYPDPTSTGEYDPRHPYQPVMHEQPQVPLSQPADAAGYHGASDIQARPPLPEATFSDEIEYSDDNSLFGDETDDIEVPEHGDSRPSIPNQALLANSVFTENDNAEEELDVDDVDAVSVGSAEFSDVVINEAPGPLRPDRGDSTLPNEPGSKSISKEPQSGLQEAKKIQKYRNNRFWNSVPAVSEDLLKEQKWQAWSSIDKGIRDPSDEEYKRWAKDEHQNLDQDQTSGAEQGDSTASAGHDLTIKGGQPYVEDFTDEDEAQLDDEISGTEIPGLASLQPEKHSSANQIEPLNESSTRKPQPLPTTKPELVGDDGITSGCGCKSGATCSCTSGQCHCSSSADAASEESSCCSSECKCGQSCACAPGQCSCQKAETTCDTLNEHVFTRPSQPQSPVRSSSPLKNFYTPREQPPVIESDDSSPIPPKPQMTPIGRPDTPRPVDSSPGVSPIRQSVEPEFPRHMIRESTPAYVDRSPSPSPVSQRGDVEMGNATPPAPYGPQEPHVGADSPINSACWTFTSTFRLHKLVQLHHDTTRYRQTIEYYEGLLIERTQRWNSAKKYDEDVRRHRLPISTTGQAPTYPVQVEVEIDQSYPVSPAHPYQTKHQVLTAEFFHRHGLPYEAGFASTYEEDMPHSAYDIPQSAPVIPSPASGSVYQGPSSAPPAILTTWPGQKPIAFPINPLYHFLTTAVPGSQVSITFKFLPRNPIQKWMCIDQSGTGHEALIHELCQSERVVSAPPRGLPPQPQPSQPTYPQSQWGTLPQPPPIPTSPTLTWPSTLRPSKTRDTPGKKDNSRRKSLGVAGGKIEKPKPRSVTGVKGSRKPTAGTKTGKSKVGDAVKKIEAAEMKGNRVVTEGSRRSARIREKVERMSSSPAPER